MKQQYALRALQWLLVIWVTSAPLCTRAQSAQPPVLQWQRVLDGDSLTQLSRLRAVKSETGGYGILAGRNLILLSATGGVRWNKPVPGSYADSSVNRISIQETVALTPAQDGGLVVLAVDVRNRYYVTKLDSTGANSWTKTVERANAGSSVRVTANTLTAAPDGSFLVIGSYVDNSLSYLSMTKLSAEGYIVGQWRVKFQGPPQPAAPLINQILPLASGKGYLLVGRAAGSATTDSKGLAIQLDAQYNVVWQRIYPDLSAIRDAVVNPTSEDTYIGIGSGAGTNGQVIMIAPNKPGDGTQPGSFPGVVSVVSLVNDGAGNVTIFDAADSNNGDFRLTNGTLPATFRWTKTFGGSGTDKPTALLSTDDGGYLAVGTTTSIDGDITGKSTNSVSAWVLKVGNSSHATTLRLLAPIYDCQTGFIRFQTSGGDGSPIIYSAPGITRANPTDNFGTIESGLRNDPKVIPIQATQQGQTVSYAFDLAAYCRIGGPANNAANTDSLRLIAPTYNCETGAITFHTAGGDGSPIEYAAAGITGWTTNPSQLVDRELRTAYDAQPLNLMARQNGKVVTYEFNLKAACGRARLAVTEPTTGLTVTILGNPVRETALVQILGAEGQSVQLHLFDARGQLVEQRTIEQAAVSERQIFDLRQQPAGTLLLRATVNEQNRRIKVIKQ